MKITEKKKHQFQSKIYEIIRQPWFLERNNLPWRKKINPYRIWVSEIMLQQTQVNRCIDYFNNWMKIFPTLGDVANSNQVKLLGAWRGLGYNSRALRMKQTAVIITQQYGGRFPKTYAELIKLPGIGPYTAGAIMNFAYNQPVSMIETNIRRVYIHEFFGHSTEQVDEKNLLELVEQTMDSDNPRIWFYALMDYGAYLGMTLKQKNKKYNPNTQSKSYTKQKTFKGSDREIRGYILKTLLQIPNHTVTISALYKQLDQFTDELSRKQSIITDLIDENFIEKIGNKIMLKM